MTEDEAKTSAHVLTCKPCRVQWDASVPRNVSMVQWTAAIEHERCPACGTAYRVASQDLTWRFQLPGAA